MELQVYTIFYFILHKKKSYIKRMRWAMPPRLPGWVPGGGGIAGGGAGGTIKREFEKKRVLPTVATPRGYRSTVGAHNPKWIIRGIHCGHIRPPGVG